MGMGTVHPIIEERLLRLASRISLVAASQDINWFRRIKLVGKVGGHLGLVRKLVAHDEHLTTKAVHTTRCKRKHAQEALNKMVSKKWEEGPNDAWVRKATEDCKRPSTVPEHVIILWRVPGSITETWHEKGWRWGEYIKQGTTIGRPAHMNKCLCGMKAAGVMVTWRNLRMSSATGGGRLS